MSWKFKPLQEGGRKLKLFEETPEGREKQPDTWQVIQKPSIFTNQAVSIWQLVPESTGSDDGKGILVFSPVKF